MYRQKECIGCGRCVKACGESALSFGKEGIEIDRSICTGCGACVRACCTGAMYTKSNMYTDEQLMRELAKDRDYYEVSGGGVTLSGGEVLAHGEYAIHIAGLVRDAGYTLAIETSGFGDYGELRELALLSDVILFDMKVMDPDKHEKYIGVRPDIIRSNLEKLAADSDIRPKIVIRVPVVKDVNDDMENFRMLADYMKKLGLGSVHLLPYHNMGVGKARQAGIVQDEFETPDDETLEKARELLSEAGIDVTVMGHED